MKKNIEPFNERETEDCGDLHRKVGLCWALLKAGYPYRLKSDAEFLGEDEDGDVDENSVWVILEGFSFYDNYQTSDYINICLDINPEYSDFKSSNEPSKQQNLRNKLIQILEKMIKPLDKNADENILYRYIAAGTFWAILKSGYPFKILQEVKEESNKHVPNETPFWILLEKINLYEDEERNEILCIDDF